MPSVVFERSYCPGSPGLLGPGDVPLLALSSFGRREPGVVMGLVTGGDLSTGRRWVSECLAEVEELRWLAFRPWPTAVLAEIDL